MTLHKSMLVARTDLKMALQVGYVKYGLIGVAALGPIMILALVGFMAFAISPSNPTEFLVLMEIMNPSIAPMLGIVAIIPASLIAANAFVGEREQNTLEPLLCTPLTESF